MEGCPDCEKREREKADARLKAYTAQWQYYAMQCPDRLASNDLDNKVCPYWGKKDFPTCNSLICPRYRPKKGDISQIVEVDPLETIGDSDTDSIREVEEDK